MPSRTTAEGPVPGGGGFSPEALLRQLAALPDATRYLVALSGGLDSTVLLHALVELRPRLAAPVAAVHIDHGLSCRSAAWTEHCADFCAGLGVPLAVRKLRIALKPGDSPEASAREARYAAIEALLEQGDALLTAHQRDDQAETLLLLLLRGSGPRGLSAMPLARPFGKGRLLRPLLGFGRDDLEGYARDRGLQWIEDESNRETRFDRNFLRRQVMPLLRERWPAASETLARSAGLCAEAEALVRGQTEKDLAAVATDDDELPVGRLLERPIEQQRALVRLWIDRQGLPPPDHRRLAELLRQVCEARAGRTLCVAWPGAEVHRYRGMLVAHAPVPAFDGENLRLSWGGDGLCELPAALGFLERLNGLGDGPLEVRFRAGGERLETPAGTRALKKVFQEAGVPAWLRSRVPLVFAAEKLVSVGDFAASPGWRFRWTRGPAWPRRSASPGGGAFFDEKNR